MTGAYIAHGRRAASRRRWRRFTYFRAWKTRRTSQAA